MPATATGIKGRWNFWAFTKNALTGDMVIYLNGHAVANGTGKTKLIDIRKMVLGMGMNGDNRYLGKFDEFSIWKKDLDEAAIQQIMNRDITNAHPDFQSRTGASATVRVGFRFILHAYSGARTDARPRPAQHQSRRQGHDCAPTTQRPVFGNRRSQSRHYGTLGAAIPD